MVFHRNLYKNIKGFNFGGYPTGLYIDTIFHGIAFANCDQVFIAKETVFYRRESSTQQSSKFYSDSQVNEFFEIITKAFLKGQHSKIKHFLSSRQKKYLCSTLSNTDFLWSGESYIILFIKKRIVDKLKYYKDFLLFWNVPNMFKVICLIYIILYPFKNLLLGNTSFVKKIRDNL